MISAVRPDARRRWFLRQLYTRRWSGARQSVCQTCTSGLRLTFGWSSP